MSGVGAIPVPGDVESYKEKYTEVLRKKEYEKFNKALNNVVRRNRHRKLEVLLDLMKTFKVEELLETKNLLRTAMTFSHYGYEACKLIMERYPEQVLTSEDNQETILHVAVARQDVEGASLILEKLKHHKDALLHQYLHTRMESSIDARNKKSPANCLELQLPLSVAAWNCDLDMIDLLVQYGASPRATNDRKQNVFHSLVEAAATADDQLMKKLTDTCKHLLRKVLNVNNTNDSLYNFQTLADILSTRDEKDNTPLTLAAERGSREMFEVIANCEVYKLFDTSIGISHTYLYDVTEIDSALCDDRRSAMHRILAGSYEKQEKFHEFADMDPILELIRIKWDSYRKWFVTWGILHLILMVLHLVFTLVEKVEVLSFIGDVLVGSYGFLLLLREGYQLIWKRNINISIMGNGLYQILLWSFGMSAIITPWLYFESNKSWITIPRSIAMIAGWLFATFFTRGVKALSSFTVMMQRALIDVLRFAFIYLLFLVPFSASMTMSFSTGQNEQFETIWKSLFSMFSVTLGLVDIDLDAFQLSHWPAFTVILYVTFLLSSYVLLLNMVIALLSDTCSQVSSIGKDQWHLQKLGIVLFIEARLLQAHRRKGGSPRSLKIFHQKNTKSSQPQTPKNVDPLLLPETMRQQLARHDFSQRYYLEKKTTTSRSFKEYQNIESRGKAGLKTTASEHEADGLERAEMLLEPSSNPGDTTAADLETQRSE